MKTSTRGIATVAGIIVAATSIFAAALSIAASNGAQNTTKSSSAAARPMLIRSVLPGSTTPQTVDVRLGPDPFALPARRIVERPRLALRKLLHADVGFLGHRRTTIRTGGDQQPPQQPAEPQLRMAGFLIGNGIYAVIDTGDHAIVVNPGDRIDDGRVVDEIRPNETRLRNANGDVSAVTLRQML
jgi:hypothetical protein